MGAKRKICMRLISVVLFLLLCAISCKKKEKEPQGILSKAQMVEWMIDMYLVEARIQVLHIMRDSAYKIFVPYQDSLMRKRGLQDSVLRKSYQYYLDHLEEFEALYDTVIDSLSLREQRLLPSPTKP